MHDLSIVVGALVSDIVVIALNYSGTFFQSERLTEWYTTFRLTAVVSDVCIISLVTLLARRIAPDCLIAASVTLQILHDYLFYLFMTYWPRPGGRVFDLLRRYAEGVGVKAILGDSMMMVITVLVARAIPEGSEMVSLLMAMYIGVYVLMHK